MGGRGRVWAHVRRVAGRCPWVAIALFMNVLFSIFISRFCHFLGDFHCLLMIFAFLRFENWSFLAFLIMINELANNQINCCKRIIFQNALLQVRFNELAVVIAAETKGGLSKVVGTE